MVVYFIVHILTTDGKFVNVTGTPGKYLTLALEKKVKTSSSWSIHSTYTTDVNGKICF
jgi:hypothetical protein